MVQSPPRQDASSGARTVDVKPLDLFVLIWRQNALQSDLSVEKLNPDIGNVRQPTRSGTIIYCGNTSRMPADGVVRMPTSSPRDVGNYLFIDGYCQANGSQPSLLNICNRRNRTLHGGVTVMLDITSVLNKKLIDRD